MKDTTLQRKISEGFIEDGCGVTSKPARQVSLGYMGEQARNGEEDLVVDRFPWHSGAEIPFDNILDRVTGSDPSVTDHILEAPAKCPNCKRGIKDSDRACIK